MNIIVVLLLGILVIKMKYVYLLTKIQNSFSQKSQLRVAYLQDVFILVFFQGGLVIEMAYIRD